MMEMLEALEKFDLQTLIEIANSVYIYIYMMYEKSPTRYASLYLLQCQNNRKTENATDTDLYPP